MSQMALLPPRTLEFTVEITPIGQGSMVELPNGKMRHSQPGLKKFREDLAKVARSHLLGAPPISKPNGVEVSVTFRLRRTGTTAMPVNSVEGVFDLDKLERALGDALERVCWENDSQIVRWHAEKKWAAGRVPSISVRIVEIPG